MIKEKTQLGQKVDTQVITGELHEAEKSRILQHVSELIKFQDDEIEGSILKNTEKAHYLKLQQMGFVINQTDTKTNTSITITFGHQSAGDSTRNELTGVYRVYLDKYSQSIRSEYQDEQSLTEKENYENESSPVEETDDIETELKSFFIDDEDRSDRLQKLLATIQKKDGAGAKLTLREAFIKAERAKVNYENGKSQQVETQQSPAVAAVKTLGLMGLEQGGILYRYQLAGLMKLPIDKIIDLGSRYEEAHKILRESNVNPETDWGKDQLEILVKELSR